MIIAGNLKYTLTFQELTLTKDSYGAETQTFNDKYILKAEKLKSTGNLTVQNMEIFDSNRMSFRLYNRPIKNNFRVIFSGQKYNITDIDVNQFNNEMIVEIELINE